MAIRPGISAALSEEGLSIDEITRLQNIHWAALNLPLAPPTEILVADEEPPDREAIGEAIGAAASALCVSRLWRAQNEPPVRLLAHLLDARERLNAAIAGLVALGDG